MSDDNFTVLYVDDDRDCLDVMRMILESRGYVMLEARSGAEGLALFESHAPDAMIVDLMMETVDSGIRLVREVRRRQPDLPIFILSSVGDRLSQYVDPADLNVTGIMQKPIRGDDVLQLLRRLHKREAS